VELQLIPSLLLADWNCRRTCLQLLAVLLLLLLELQMLLA
jgi:hypothetical protein